MSNRRLEGGGFFNIILKKINSYYDLSQVVSTLVQAIKSDSTPKFHIEPLVELYVRFALGLIEYSRDGAHRARSDNPAWE